VCIVASLCAGTQQLALTESSFRQTILFIVNEEEYAIFDDRSANSETGLIQDHAGAWLTGQVVEIVVGVQRWVTQILICAAIKTVACGSGDEFDLDCAFARAFCTRRGSRYGYFIDSVGLWLNVSKETVAGFQQVVLNVQTVNRDVQSAFWQTVNRRLTRT